IPRGMLIAAITWLYRTSLIVAPFFLSAGCWLALFGAGVAADSMFLIFITGKMNIRSYLKYLLHFEIYYTIYAAAIPFIATLSKRVVWKERSL
ncbi:MAG TPA: hypothetical protein VKS81_04375, partial [Bacteroidota bacterium]|nr:hypothetical protein [Bacteroidota bacterium]